MQSGRVESGHTRVSSTQQKMQNRLSALFQNGPPMAPPGTPPPTAVAPSPGPVKKRPISGSISGPDVSAMFPGGAPAGLANALRARAGTTLAPGGSPVQPPPSSGSPAPSAGISAGAAEGAPSPPSFPITIIASEAKGKEVTLTLAPELTIKEVVDELLKAVTIKNADKLSPYLKDGGIFLDTRRTLGSYLIHNKEKLVLKPKEKKTAFLTVSVSDGADKEIVEVYPTTTAWGVIQLLTKRPATLAEVEAYGLFKLEAKGETRVSNDSAFLPEKLFKAGASVDIFLLFKKGGPSPAVDKKDKRKTLAAPLAKVGSGPLPEEEPDKQKKMSKLNTFLKGRPDKDSLVKKGVLQEVEPPPAPGSIPLKLEVFEQLCKFLSLDLNLVGMFRVSGGVADVRALYSSFTGSAPLDLTTSRNDPHIASSALKLYLRELKNPLMTFDLYAEFMRAMKKDDQERVAALKAAIEKLPDVNGRIVRYLFGFLVKVSEHQEENKMSPSNLGIVFGPTIMWNPDTNSLNFESTNVQSDLVAVIIENYDKIYDSNPFLGGTAAAQSPSFPVTAAPQIASPAPSHPVPPMMRAGPPKAPPPAPPKQPPPATPPGALLEEIKVVRPKVGPAPPSGPKPAAEPEQRPISPPPPPANSPSSEAVNTRPLKISPSDAGASGHKKSPSLAEVSKLDPIEDGPEEILEGDESGSNPRRRSKKPKKYTTSDIVAEIPPAFKSLVSSLATATEKDQRAQLAAQLLASESILVAFAKAGGDQVAELVVALTKALA